MQMDLLARTALVTASSGGMGANIARALAAEGADLVLFARSAEPLQALAEEIRGAHGVRVLPVVGSLLVAADLDRLAAGISGVFGSLDIAVLNTGRPPAPLRAAADETEKARWDVSYDLLLSAVIEVTTRVLPLMARDGGGRIVAITSASTHQPMPRHALSTVFRAGVEAYMKHLSQEVGDRGITVNCVAPALIETPHRQGSASYTPEQTERRRKMNALKRLGRQEEVCALVAFLVSGRAGFITGESIRIDGGLVSALHGAMN